MASSVTKQQYYRRLMKEQKSKVASSQQTKITHPLARYNALDQLVCVLCNIQVKSELLWKTHLQSRKHKECVSALKAAKAASPNVPSSTNSSSADPPVGPSQGTIRGMDAAGPLPGPQTAVIGKGKRKLSKVEETPEEAPRKKKSKRHNLPSATPASTKSGLPAGFFDSNVAKKFHPHGEEVFYESSESEEEEEMQTGESTSRPTLEGVGVAAPPPNGPADRTPEITPSETKSKDPKKGLPEGFFDDPKKDAKARHVEYKDPMTEEWERFQKSIQKEDDISEVILFEGDEEAMEERELEEVNQQVHCFTKAEQLRQQYEKVLTSRAAEQADNDSKMNTESNSSEEDETDFDEFLNWRAKIS